MLLIRVLAIILTLGWLGREVGGSGDSHGRSSACAPLLGDPGRRLAAVGAVGIALTTALATAASVAPLVSLLGSWDRQQGV